jgi:hypothetical protein
LVAVGEGDGCAEGLGAAMSENDENEYKQRRKDG